MSAPALTPGPWRAITNGPLSHAIVESDTLTIANGIVNHANARFIAAAPDLYEALRRMFMSGGHEHAECAPEFCAPANAVIGHRTATDDSRVPCRYAAARAALAKAVAP